MSAKQDRVYTRTASDVERKYCFGKTFGELLGLAQAAKDAADGAQEKLDGMDAEEIFNILTGGGQEQGIYRIGGKIYLNANYIKSGQLLADLIKAGVLQSNDGETFYLDLESGELKGNFTELSIAGESVGQIAQNVMDAQTQVEIFSKLTDGGRIQGIFMQDGQIYVNASFISTGLMAADLIDVTSLFAMDIDMSGKFTSSAMAYIPPTMADVNAMYSAFIGETMPPEDGSFDLNGDGDFDIVDVQLAFNVLCGKVAMSSCAGAEKREATIVIDMSDSEKTICISGTNQWGSYVESYMGVDYTNSKYVAKEQMETMICQDDLSGPLYRKVFGSDELEYFNPPMVENTEYRTIERWLNAPVYTRIVAASEADSLPYSIIRRSETVDDKIQIWYIK